MILAGDPMQLPPTIISIDKGKKANKTDTSTSTKQAAKSSSKKPAAKTEPVSSQDDAEPESGDEDVDSNEDEGDTELTADPEEPLKSTPRDPRKAGSKAVLRPPRTLETTLFERLEKMYGPGIKRMLTVQYRFVAEHVV